MADNFDVVVDMSMDEEGNKEVIDGAKTVEQHFKEMQRAAENAGKTVNQVMDEASQHTGTFTQAQSKAGNEVRKTTEDIKKEAKEAAQAASAQAQIWNTQARILQTRGRLMQLQSRDLMKVADAFNIVGRSLLVGGTLVTGGIFKAANDFVENAPNATRLTLQWKKAQDDLNNSYSRFGAVAARAALPLLQQAADVAAKAAKFMEDNPGVVKAALNVGLLSAGLGAISILVAKGVKLQADLLFVQSVPIMQEAANLNMAAAEQMLVAAQLNAEAKGIEVETAVTSTAAKAAGGGGLLGAAAGLVGSVVAMTTALAGGAIIADKAFDAIQGHDVTFKDYVTTLKQSLAIDAKNLGDRLSRSGLLGGAVKLPGDLGTQWFEKVGEALGVLKNKADDTADSLDNLAGSVAGSPKKEELLAAYEKYQADDLKLVQDHYKKRQDIISSELNDELKENAKYRDQVSKVNTDTGKALADLSTNYNKQAVEAEQKLAEDRAKVLADAGDDIKNIEADLQEQLRKNRLEHEDRLSDIISKRDALAFVKENRRYDQQQSEERRQANIEIRKRREELAKRLNELDVEYAAERQKRYEEYVQRAIEIKQQAAERLKELAAQHQEELQQIHSQAAAKIAELDKEFIAERKRRYDYFIAEVRDLDASLLGQRNLKLQYQQKEMADLDAFLARYRAGLQTITSGATPGHAAGGYTSGIVRTGEKGYEWIATHASTTAAENIIGGKLTQETFMRAMQALQFANSGTYVDNRRMEFPMSKDNKQAYKQGAKEALAEVLGLRS